MLLALLGAGAVVALQAPFSYAKVIGFSGDGKSALFDASIDAPSPGGEQIAWAEHVYVVIGDDGRPLHVARYVESRAEGFSEDEIKVTAEARRLWDGAESVEQGRRLSSEVKDTGNFLPGATGKMKGPASAGARVESSGVKACPTQRLFITLRGREALAFEDACPGGSAGDPGQSLTYAWSPSGSALAVAWTVARGDVDRGYLGVLTSDNLGALDVLIAGGAAGPALDSLAAAGFRVGHRGAAVKKRDETAVYFAPGFEREAAAVAAALGAPASAARPVSWKTPYAVTVALGAR